jgi:hypothetical protein
MQYIVVDVAVHVERVRLCLRPAYTNGPIVHPPNDMSMKSHSGMIPSGRNRKTRRIACPHATLGKSPEAAGRGVGNMALKFFKVCGDPRQF